MWSLVLATQSLASCAAVRSPSEANEVGEMAPFIVAHRAGRSGPAQLFGHECLFGAEGEGSRRSAGRANRGHPPFVSVALAPSRGLLPMTRAPFAASVCDMTTVLVTFASSTGPPRRSPKRSPRRCANPGFQVDCVKGCELESLDGYDAVILGSAVYLGALAPRGPQVPQALRR